MAIEIRGKSNAIGMGQSLRQRQCFIAPFQSLIRIAEDPERVCPVAQAIDSGVNAKSESECSMAVKVIDSGCLFEMFSRWEQFSHLERSISHCDVSVHLEDRIVRAPCRAQQLACQFIRSR